MASHSGVKYDVFISFRGTDIRSGFLSHLKKEMRQKQVDAYVDERLEGGDEISPTLLKAIEESHISLIIFSKDYASSSWCLEELVKIIECMTKNKQIVIPVFYNIDPSDVRHQKRTYAEAFDEHEKNNGNLDKVQIWRTALNKAANLSGFHSSKFGDEDELIEAIVKCLLSKLTPMYPSKLTQLVGIEERIADVESLLCLESTIDVRVIGIWGMGGIGKTTLATEVYNRLCFQYEGCCFMANITEESKKHGIIDMKNKIFSILLKENDLHIGTPNRVPPNIERRLVCKKVLLVLDDINDSEHLENLVGALDCFGSGSRIIITTRDKQVLTKKVSSIYEAKALSYDEATELFISNALKDSCLDMEWNELSRKVIQYANGNPLALKVLGSFLLGKSKLEWESQLQKLKKMPHSKIQNALRLSYDRLDQEEKNIFLYIACVFKGCEFQRMIPLLDACGFSTTIALKVLQDNALIIKAKEYGISIVQMHDLIQEMGWQIVREECVEDPGKRSRLWDSNDIRQVLKNNTGTEAIKSIALDVSKSDVLCLGPQVFARMQRLKFLKVTRSYEQKLYFPEGFESLPNELVLFHWDSYPLKSFPQSFCAENLVELEMVSSRMEKLWDGTQNIENLKKINLAYSKYLLELPDFSKASNLEEVNLFNCTSLRNVHPSILSLKKLVLLNLFKCIELTSLRSETHLRSLCRLLLGGCSKLKEFSVTSENMIFLDLSLTVIHELPSSIGCLKKLKTLTLNGCLQLDASNLHIICNGLVSLEKLCMAECRNLTEISGNISLLSSLSELLLSRTDIERFPASIKHLSNLQKLYINGCQRLRFLPELPSSIKELHADNCSSLETVMFTSRAAELLQASKTHTLFQNCGKLDERSLNDIGVSAYLNMKKLAYDNFPTIGSKLVDGTSNVIYPGSKIPKWFMYRTTQASITVDLSSSPPFKFVGFIFCVIISQLISSYNSNFFGCHCYLETSVGDKVWLKDARSRIRPSCDFFSNHVCLWYDDLYSLQNSECKNESTEELMVGYHPKLSFEFFARNEKTWKNAKYLRIKGCGVCPIYDTEYSNFIEQMGLEMELDTHLSRMPSPNQTTRPLGHKPMMVYPKKRRKIETGAENKLC